MISPINGAKLYQRHILAYCRTQDTPLNPPSNPMQEVRPSQESPIHKPNPNPTPFSCIGVVPTSIPK